MWRWSTFPSLPGVEGAKMPPSSILPCHLVILKNGSWWAKKLATLFQSPRTRRRRRTNHNYHFIAALSVLTDDIDNFSPEGSRCSSQKQINMDPNGSSSSPSSKRLKLDDNSTLTTTYSPKEICTFGEKCYRRNIHHFREYSHPHLEQLYEAMMTESQDLSQLPKDYVPTLDKSVVLDQVKILKSAGYKHSVKQTKQNEDNDTKTTTKSTSSLWNKLVDSDSLDTECILLDSPPSSTSTEAKKLPSPSKSYWNKAKPRSPGCQLTPAEKWEASSPFNLFLTSIGPERTSFSIGFPDLFHQSFEEVSQVCHISFMVEMDWLMDHIVSTSMWGKPTTIVYGAPNPEIDKTANEFDWMASYKMKSPHIYGHHHTKMSLIEYDDHSIRFLVYTANLIENDWLNKTQGIWISPKCPPLASKDCSGESPTGFRADILSYLATYQLKLLEGWMKKISEADCSKIKVVLVGSAPNQSHSGGSSNGFRWGLKKMESTLKQHQTAPVDPKWPIIAQCSSIGSLGSDETWLHEEFANLLEGPKKPFAAKPPVKLVYPSVTDVMASAEGKEGADCLPYSNSVHAKQLWIERHMCKWVGFRYNRTYALPHIKTYCRVSPDYKHMAWFLLTSSNLSKAAWGKLNKKRDQLMIMSWECGVLFLPKFLTGTDSFDGETTRIDNGSVASSRIAMEHHTVGYPFPVPYDLPVHPYMGDCKAWLVDYLGHPRR